MSSNPRRAGSRARALAVCTALLAAAPAGVIDAAEPLRPLRAASPPVIDGRLDEDLWQKAPSATGFKTWLPDFGADLSEQTIAYYAYDAENLYFAFRAYDREPSKIKASMAHRDSIRPDDWVCVNLDSFNDQQALYGFYVNPLGIQMDSRYAANKEDLGFDTVWYSAGRIDERGYTVEMRIPFKSIRYTGHNPVRMGVIFERMISRKTEDGTVPALDPRMGLNFLIQMAPIEFPDIEHYTLIEVLPAATYARQDVTQEGRLANASSVADLGVTARYGITAQLTVDGTYHPDFSQVEADAGQIDINLRTPLFFPEKRPFFLEGQEVFNLGGPTDRSPLHAVVHTRTIVNPLAGVKMSGKIARNDTVASLYAVDDLPSAGTTDAPADRAHVTVLRYRRSLSQDSYLGGVYAGRELAGGFNRVAGADGTLRISQSAAVGFYALASATRIAGRQAAVGGRAIGVEYVRTTRELSLSAGGHDISTGFAADTGYLTRAGVTSVWATAVPKFYPARGRVQRIEVSVATEQTRDASSGRWETFNEGSVLFRFRGAVAAKAACHASSEVFSGREFGTSGCGATVSAQVTKQLKLQATWAARDAIYYGADPSGGRTAQATASIVYQPSEQWYHSVSVTYANFDRASDGQRLYDYAIARGKTSFQVNRFLFFRGIVEYNSFRRQILTDVLASFTYIPGTVLHAGYGSLYEQAQPGGLDEPGGRSFRETRRGLFFKASYFWRL